MLIFANQHNIVFFIVNYITKYSFIVDCKCNILKGGTDKVKIKKLDVRIKHLYHKTIKQTLLHNVI